MWLHGGPHASLASEKVGQGPTLSNMELKTSEKSFSFQSKHSVAPHYCFSANKSNVRVYLALQCEDTVHVAVKHQQELEAAGQESSTVRGRGDINAGVQLTFSFSLGLDLRDGTTHFQGGPAHLS